MAVCDVCELEFTDYASNRRKGEARCCSADCRSAWTAVVNSIRRGGDGVKRTKPEKDALDYRKHADHRRAAAVARYTEQRDAILSTLRQKARALKREVIDAYGGACVCCGEATIEFLTIDHTDGSGAEHRRRVGKGRGIYQDLKRRGFPQDGYACRCFNCNIALGFYGYCPHRPNERRQIDKRAKTNVGRPRIVAPIARTA